MMIECLILTIFLSAGWSGTTCSRSPPSAGRLLGLPWVSPSSRWGTGSTHQDKQGSFLRTWIEVCMIFVFQLCGLSWKTVLEHAQVFDHSPRRAKSHCLHWVPRLQNVWKGKYDLSNCHLLPNQSKFFKLSHISCINSKRCFLLWLCHLIKTRIKPGSADVSTWPQIGLRAVCYYMTTTLMAVTLGILLTITIRLYNSCQCFSTTSEPPSHKISSDLALPTPRRSCTTRMGGTPPPQTPSWTCSPTAFHPTWCRWWR